MATTSTALSLGDAAIRQLDGLYSLNDLHAAAGGERKHQPAFFLRRQETQALLAELGHSADSQTGLRIINGGTAPGTYACRELVIAYAAWISAAFHLKVIRVFLEQAPGAAQVPAKVGQVRRWLMVSTDGAAPTITPLADDVQIISATELAEQAHQARIAELRKALAAHEKTAKDHRDTMWIYEQGNKPGHRTRYLSHVAQAAEADWYAEDVRDKLRALGVPVPALIGQGG